MKANGDSDEFFENKSIQKYGILLKKICINFKVMAIEMKIQVCEV
jgi:hypothetical protein